ncbi:Glypican-5 Secreted glypican-5, partial [Takifugu flavidus]
YTLRVVGSGIKAQSTNPEVKVKGVDPVVNQIIDKLKHINQLLQGKSIPKLGSLDQIETGSGDAEGQYSGDCDDEDGCGSSGGGESRRKNSRVVKRKGVMEATSLPEKLSVTPPSGDLAVSPSAPQPTPGPRRWLSLPFVLLQPRYSPREKKPKRLLRFSSAVTFFSGDSICWRNA